MVDIAKTPAGNLRVPRDDFAALWIVAEQHQEQQVTDWYGAGVVVTCRWLANATVRTTTGPWRPARAPVSHRTALACPELIEAECLAAEVLASRQPAPDWLTGQPGWIDGVVATLNWAWRGSSGPPMDLPHSATG